VSVTSVTSFSVFHHVISSLISLSAMNLFVVISACPAHPDRHFVDLNCLNVSSVGLSVGLIASFSSLSKKLSARSKRDCEFLDIADSLSHSSFDSITSKYFKISLNLPFENAEEIHLILIKLHKMKNHLNKQLRMLKRVHCDD
jgi:hypothetical protein